jgi:uncharacterized membrane protein SpoIIM required for sporulation
MINLNVYEEAHSEQELEKHNNLEELTFMQRYKDVIKIYIAFFLGMILTFSIIYIMLPGEASSHLFDDQIKEIEKIRGTGRATLFGTFETIIMNNVGVLFLAFLFSFIFGAGAIFILAWNASILSVAIGSVARLIGGFTSFPKAVMMYFPHGSLEIFAYFIAAIAGGIASAAITRRKSKNFWLVMKDCMKLMGVAVVFLVLAGLIESSYIVG